VVLAAPVAGIVAEVVPRVGDRVEAGALVVALDQSLIGPREAVAKANLGRVESDLAQSRRELARVSKLASPVVTEAEKEKFKARVDSLVAQVASERASVRLLAAEAKRHTIQAPFAGVARARKVEPGAWVNPGTALVELVSAGDVEVVVDVAASLLASLKRGGKATLGRGERQTPATIVGLVPTLDEVTRTARVRLLADARPDWLLAGRPVEVTFEVVQPADGVLVPRDALVRGPGGVRIMAAKDGKAISLPVTIVATDNILAMVRPPKPGDLAAGMQVVVRGNERLRPDQAIAPEPLEAPASPASAAPAGAH
jgi:RND family efflux transporter MFP subunit